MFIDILRPEVLTSRASHGSGNVLVHDNCSKRGNTHGKYAVLFTIRARKNILQQDTKLEQELHESSMFHTGTHDTRTDTVRNSKERILFQYLIGQKREQGSQCENGVRSYSIPRLRAPITRMSPVQTAAHA